MEQDTVSGQRRRRAWITLGVLSLVLFGGTLLCNVGTGLLSGGERTFSVNALQQNRWLWGTLVGIFFLALMWAGAGLAYAVGRIKASEPRRLMQLLVFVCLPLGIACLVTLPLFVLWVQQIAPTPQWRALPPLPEPAAQVADADSDHVFVKTASGKIYGCVIYNPPPDCWQEMPVELNTRYHPQHIEVAANAVPLPNVVSTLGVQTFPTAETSAQYYYAVLADGTVYMGTRAGASALVILLGWLLPVLACLGVALLSLPFLLGAVVIWVTLRRAPVNG